MLAEVISIGDELTSGQRLDTNSQWLSQRLGELGVGVRFHTTVADDLAANEAVFRAAAERADVVVATGGLGPTADDLTREALAAAAGVPLVLDEGSLAHIRGLFARHGRPMPERNALQAQLPQGSRPIFNPQGTAPGIRLDLPRPGGGVCRVFALPGVPAEMRQMFAESVAAEVSALLPAPRVILHRRIKCFGVGESQLEQMLPDLIRRGREPAVGITVHEATITLRVTAAGSTADACRAAMEPAVDTIRTCLGELVFGEEDDELEDAVVRLLAERGQTLATVEWGSQGLLARGLAAAGGARRVVAGGVVVGPAGAAAVAGGPDPLTRAGVSAAAGWVRAEWGADFGLAVGGFPPEGGPANCYLALADARRTQTHAGALVSHRAIWEPLAAKQAINLLRLVLLGR